MLMDLRPRETVILAAEFSTLVDWYRDVLGFEVIRLFENGYRYCNLQTGSGIKIGIAPAEEVGVELGTAPDSRQNNPVLIQFEVDDVKEFLQHVETSTGNFVRGKVTFGPSFDQQHEFWYGGFSDPEGNPCWVVDRNCP